MEITIKPVMEMNEVKDDFWKKPKTFDFRSFIMHFLTSFLYKTQLCS